MLYVVLNNIKVHRGRYEEFLANIISLSSEESSSYICFANAHMLVEAWSRKDYAEILNKSCMICPDGKPVGLLISYLTKTIQERVCGMDMVPDLIKRACRDRLKIFFVGPDEATIKGTKHTMDAAYPGHDSIAGFYIPAVSPDSSDYNDEIVQMINTSGADLVFVSLGCPKQERWMYNHYQKINVPLLGVGGALPVYAGLQKRAPVWMQRLALEWFYRFIQEPRRLFKRYFITNAIFIYNALIILAFNKVVCEKD